MVDCNLYQRDCTDCKIMCQKQSPLDYNQRWNLETYEDFPVKIICTEKIKSGPVFESHWHQQFQIIYFQQGEALILCNSHTYQVKPESLVIINSNEIHYGQTLSLPLIYYIVKVDLTFLLSNRMDFCQTKYINPLLQERIRFQNYISQDSQLIEQVKKIITEYRQEELGFELAVKANIYYILVSLLRDYQQENHSGYNKQQQETLAQLRTALEYVDQHYWENISLNHLASLANMSKPYFCSIFKRFTGKRPMDYINYLRINKAVGLLSNTNLNISQVANAVGIVDSNYFSRLFKKYQKTSPSAMRRKV